MKTRGKVSGNSVIVSKLQNSDVKVFTYLYWDFLGSTTGHNRKLGLVTYLLLLFSFCIAIKCFHTKHICMTSGEDFSDLKCHGTCIKEVENDLKKKKKKASP